MSDWLEILWEQTISVPLSGLAWTDSVEWLKLECSTILLRWITEMHKYDMFATTVYSLQFCVWSLSESELVNGLYYTEDNSDNSIHW